MRDNFERSLPAVLKHEGGWADHPSDPGGATMRGVTIGTYRQYKPGATKDDLRNITDQELRRIYKDGYWDKIRGDALPAGVDYATFDYAVNSGPARAAMHLQEIVGVAPDGKIGPLTLAAVDKWDSIALIEALCGKRMSFLKRLSTWPTFGKGWSSRVTGVLRLAKDMAIAFPAPVPAKPAPAPIPQTSASPRPKTVVDWLKGLFIKQATNHVLSTMKDKSMLTSNGLHNILNVAIALLAGVTAFLLATGCSQLVTGALDCSASWIDPVWTTGITAGLGILKTIINVARDGFGGLFKQQPPVR